MKYTHCVLLNILLVDIETVNSLTLQGLEFCQKQSDSNRKKVQNGIVLTTKWDKMFQIKFCFKQSDPKSF